MSDLLTTAEAARELRCHPETIKRAIRCGKIRARFFGGRYLIERSALPAELAPPAKPPGRPAKQPGHFARVAREMDAS